MGNKVDRDRAAGVVGRGAVFRRWGRSRVLLDLLRDLVGQGLADRLLEGVRKDLLDLVGDGRLGFGLGGLGRRLGLGFGLGLVFRLDLGLGRGRCGDVGALNLAPLGQDGGIGGGDVHSVGDLAEARPDEGQPEGQPERQRGNIERHARS
ncbi:MAG TPA: hypothetical protein ENJ00_09385 [Phycisphaerales bacterium]|nr:hypothetical protein [Phycisphaerales bacterium]